MMDLLKQQKALEEQEAIWEQIKVDRYDRIFPDGASERVLELFLMLRRHRELKIFEANIPGVSRYKQSAKIADAMGAKAMQLNEREKKSLLEANRLHEYGGSEEKWQEFLEVHLKRNPGDKNLIAEIKSRLSAMPVDLSKSSKR